VQLFIPLSMKKTSYGTLSLQATVISHTHHHGSMRRWWTSSSGFVGTPIMSTGQHFVLSRRTSFSAGEENINDATLANWHPKFLPLETFLRRLQCVSTASTSPRGLPSFFRVATTPTPPTDDALQMAVADRIRDASQEMLSSETSVDSTDVARISLLASSALRLHLPASSRCVEVSVKAFLVIVQCAGKGGHAASRSSERSSTTNVRRRLRLPSISRVVFRTGPSPEVEAEVHMAWTRLIDAAAHQQQHHQRDVKPLLHDASSSKNPSKLSLPLIAEVVPVLEQSSVWASLFEPQQRRREEHQALAVMMHGFIVQCIALVLRTDETPKTTPSHVATGAQSQAAGVAEIDRSSLLDQLARMQSAVTNALHVDTLPADDLISIVDGLHLLILQLRGVPAASTSWWGTSPPLTRASTAQMSEESDSFLRETIAALSLRLQRSSTTATTTCIEPPRLLVALRASLMVPPSAIAPSTVMANFMEERVRALSPPDIVKAVPWLLELLYIAATEMDDATVLARHVANVLLQYPYVAVEAELLQLASWPASSPTSASLRLSSPVVVPLLTLLERHSHKVISAASLSKFIASVVDATEDLCDNSDQMIALYLRLCIAVPQSMYRCMTSDETNGVFWARVLPVLCRLADDHRSQSLVNHHGSRMPPLACHIYAWAVVVLLHAAVESPTNEQVDRALELLLGGIDDSGSHWSEGVKADKDWKTALSVALRQFMRSQKGGARSRLSRHAMARLHQPTAIGSVV
jgi:hypothetical protein